MNKALDLNLLQKRTGSLQQLAYVRPVTFGEGRAKGMDAYSVKNGPVSFIAMADKCLDITDFSYKGVNMSFLSKPGLSGRNHFDTHGAEAQRSIMGGLFFTCGLENICPPCEDDGKEYPMHGRLRTTPAEHLCADAVEENGKYVIRLSGEMREAELFGENMVLRRSIEAEFGSKTVIVRDKITNHAFREETLMLLYHFNIGYPLLDEGSELILPTLSVTPRDDNARAVQEKWNIISAPSDNAPEQVFIHELADDGNGNTFAALINNDLGLGLKLEFNQSNLPNFMEWKSSGSGDFVLGLEPANSSVYGRLHQKKLGLHTLAPLKTECNELRITVLEGMDELKAVRVRAEQMKENKLTEKEKAS